MSRCDENILFARAGLYEMDSADFLPFGVPNITTLLSVVFLIAHSMIIWDGRAQLAMTMLTIPSNHDSQLARSHTVRSDAWALQSLAYGCSTVAHAKPCLLISPALAQVMNFVGCRPHLSGLTRPSVKGYFAGCLDPIG